MDIPQRILQQVGKELLQPAGIGHDRNRAQVAAIGLDAYTPLFEPGGKRSQGLSQDLQGD